MVWTTVNDPIKLDIDWQFTEPVEGTFFRFKHETPPVNAIYEIAQVEANDDGSYTLFDSQVLTVERGFVDTIKLVKPGIFTQRRLAIRQLPARPTFEQEIRRLLLPGYLQLNEDSPIAVARNRWQVQIESSDYVESGTAVDLSPIQTKLDEISQKIDNLQSSGGNTTPSNTKILSYVSDGDENGVCYWIGTNYGAETWSNPHTAGRLVVELSAPYDGANNNPQFLVDRQPSAAIATADTPNSWISLDLGISKSLVCKYYTLRGRTTNSGHPRSWKLQGSNNASNWTDLDTQTNNSTIVNNTWFRAAVTSTIAFRYFRILQIGASSTNENYLSFGEWEFYGEFIKQ